jgi:hypothetical protein
MEEKKKKKKEKKKKKKKEARIFTITMLDYFPHMSQCLSSGEDRI